MQTEPAIRWIGRPDHPVAQAFYATLDYQTPIGIEDAVLAAYASGRMVGVVRLASESGHVVLRGMFVDEVWRGVGVGRRMLDALVSRLGGARCWLLCHARVEAFYDRAGFVRVANREVPPHLGLRLEAYRERWPDMRAMCRS